MKDEERILQSVRDALTAKSAQLWLESFCAVPLADDVFRHAMAAREDPIDADELQAVHTRAIELLPFPDAKSFARNVWAAERPDDPMVQVSRQEDFPDATRAEIFNSNAAAEARWAAPYADQIGMARRGELAGTTGPVPYIDLTDEALQQISLLHELAHLLVDTEEHTSGHGDVWAAAFAGLLDRHVHPFTADLWRLSWEAQKQKTAERIAHDPNWGRNLLPGAE